MKIIIYLIIFAMQLFADTKINENDINGIWEIPEEIEGFASIGEIFTQDKIAHAYAFAYAKKAGDKLVPRILDDENKNANNLKGKIFLSNLEFNGKKWVNGRIYNPNNGGVYYAEAHLSQDKNTLFIKTSIDSFGIIGITLKWYRIQDTKYTPLNHDEVIMIDELKENK
ncbi:DUF2147 domain-containing protein [Helicobacter sp. MIT 99-5507]|uniref:DUF2147 domain-containing protein n=1 Tax=Helicobacter sp. MIT 99-5507 TaxID=152489 RepID=UPI000E1F6A74|nr:DUF2147 domain-containing protein [Helicobacter sp. MIT 99-5507]RDU58661.1 hypothetical protein CQA42_02475 [Helicobacter sp. MIT 99-5507]